MARMRRLLAGMRGRFDVCSIEIEDCDDAWENGVWLWGSGPCSLQLCHKRRKARSAYQLIATSRRSSIYMNYPAIRINHTSCHLESSSLD